MDTSTASSILHAIREFVPSYASIAISDSSQYLYYEPSQTIDLRIRPGDRVKEGTATYKALLTQNKISEYIGKDILGISYFGTSVPILEGERPSGCITMILPTKPATALSKFLTVRTEDRWLPISYEQILYLEAQNRKTKVQSMRGSAFQTGYHKYNLMDFEFILPNDLFIRVHRSYFVNINFISEIHPDSHSTFLLTMKDKTRIPVSQTYASYFRKTLHF